MDAAVAQAAYRVISEIYTEEQMTLDHVLATRLAVIPKSAAKTAGISLGNQIAQQYINAHQNDGWNLPDQYTPSDAPGHWSSDPLHPGQKGWGSDWGSVHPWAMPNPDHFDAVLNLPDITSQRYTDAYYEVKAYGSRVSDTRTADQTAIGLFWAYDRPGTGAPPVLFSENMIEIGNQIGNSPEQNARMFAMASVALADAIIATWDVKYEADLWRPITGIRRAAEDDNPDTIEDLEWAPLGSPGADPNGAADDFTPPFPAYTSGHATMGGAIYRALELFYGTNDFSVADAMIGVDAVTDEYALFSIEPGGGGTREYVRFTQDGALGPGLENSPEGENTMSRIYLGVHWRMDQEDGQALGRAVSDYVASRYFQPVPEPSTWALLLSGGTLLAASRRKWRGKS